MLNRLLNKPNTTQLACYLSTLPVPEIFGTGRWRCRPRSLWLNPIVIFGSCASHRHMRPVSTSGLGLKLTLNLVPSPPRRPVHTRPGAGPLQPLLTCLPHICPSTPTGQIPPPLLQNLQGLPVMPTIKSKLLKNAHGTLLCGIYTAL